MDNPEFICPKCKRGPVEGHEPLCEVMTMYPAEELQAMYALSQAMSEIAAARMRHKTHLMRH